MADKFLNYSGLSYIWNKIVELFNDKWDLPTYHSVILNSDGTISSYASTLTYATVKANLVNQNKIDYLDCTQDLSRFCVPVVQDIDTTNSPIRFTNIYTKDGFEMLISFDLYSDDTLTVQYFMLETTTNKVQSVVSNVSNTLYPSTNAVYSEFQRKPVVIWESDDPTQYLKAISSNISVNPTWQLTDLDMTPFKRIKIYSCAGQGTGSTASASTTSAMILEMSLDDRASISAYGGNFVGSVISQKPNDNNRLATLTCAVSHDKTSFVVLRQTNLYGTAATQNNDVNANVYMIEGYYD